MIAEIFKKMKKIIYLSILFLAFGCQSEKYKDVGDIPFDPEWDDPKFELCQENLIKQYYIRKSSDTAPTYKGEKRGLEEEVNSKYSYAPKEDQTGYITIRFIINCHGKSGRFRIEEMDFDLEPMKFDVDLSSQIMDIVKGLKDWSPRTKGARKYDFYQYLTFKIESGQITKILP